VRVNRLKPEACLLLALAFAAFALPFAVGGVESASAHHKDSLLAPRKVCPKQKKRSLSLARQERAMRCMHNYARKRRGVPRMRKRKDLRWSARRKAEDIIQCQDLSHNACGRDAFYWMRRSGFARGCYAVSENIGRGRGRRGSVRAMMSAWLHSDAHRRGLLAKRYRKFGIGAARHSSTQVWVAHFGRRC